MITRITPHRRAPHPARLSVENLTFADRGKDEFLAIVAHELRTPLPTIRHAVRFLSRQADEKPARQKMHALLECQVHRMTQLLDDLLDVSRIANGSLQLQRARIDLRVVLNHAIETCEPDIKASHHRLTTTLPDAPVWLQGDPGRLEQVFVNLLANAAKYTDAGGALAVGVHTQDGQAVIGVRDSGMGIASDVLPHVFDLFKQANATDPRSQSGLGIGLAVVRHLVELHGGSVMAASAGSGQGSEFTVRLPRDEAASAVRTP